MSFRDGERQKVFERRVALLGFGKLALLSTLVGRMYYLQVLQEDKYRTLSDQNRLSTRVLLPPRGQITDRQGRPLAVNRRSYQLLIIPERVEDFDGTLKTLATIIPLTPKEMARIKRDAKRKRGFVPVKIRDDLSWKDVAQIEVNLPDLPGISIEMGRRRFYPHGKVAAHVLGYTASPSEKTSNASPLLSDPDFKVGQTGIERVYDQKLRGAPGLRRVEVNAVGREIRDIDRVDETAGQNLALSLDLKLQKKASELMTGVSGAVVVIDVTSGEIVTMASSPSFNPEDFEKGMTPADWRKLINDPFTPLVNKAVHGQYAPGSTFKMAVALAALEGNRISPNETIYCPGHFDIGTARFHCWKRGGHGNVTVTEAIQQSCDVYFYETARRTGIERIAEMSHRLGLGHNSGIDLPGEQPGLIPDKKWKRSVKNERWQLGETVLTGIGQGFVLTTPLQLAVMTARIANGRAALSPHFALDKNTSTKRSLPELGVRNQNLDLIRNAMFNATNTPKGTSFNARIKEEPFAMAGKTGTAQVRRITRAEREQGVISNSDLPWKARDHALFVGFAPFSMPKFAISVVIEHGGSGSTTAAPIARDVLWEAQKLRFV